MPVNDPNSNDQESGKSQAPQSEHSQDRNTQRQAPVMNSILDVNRLLGGGMSRRTSGEQLIAAIAACKFWFSSERQVAAAGAIDLTKIQVIGLEATEHNVEVSSVILAYPVESHGTQRIMTHFLALESSLSDDSLTRTVNVNHRDYPLPVVVSDFVTESYQALVDEIAKKHFEQSRRNVEICRTGWRTVSRKVNFAEPESTETRSVVFYAQAALVAMYNHVYNNDLFFSLEWLSKQSTLEIAVDMSGRETHSADGLPRRRDIAVNVAGKVAKGDQTASVGLAQLGGYISLVYSPPQEEDRWRRDVRRDTPYFTPTLIINSIDTGTNSITPEQLLLGLAGASVVSSNQAWAQTFLPSEVSRGEIDYRDTGLLGLLGPDKVAVEFEARTHLDTEKWGQYFFSLVNEHLAWAIELEEGGDNSWVTGLLLDAASDTSPNHEAINRLYDYADRLTNNHFRRRAKELGVETPIQLSGARYLTGTWIDDKGEERDLRDWDLLRWLGQNPTDEGASALNYQDVVDRLDLDVEVRVSEQYTQLTSALGAANVKFARYVDLALINPLFIQALAAAVADCKINIDQRSAHYSFGARRLRGNTRIREFVGGDLTNGMLTSRRVTGGNERSLRGHTSNGFGHGTSF